MNDDQHNRDALTRPAAATADGEATDGLINSNDLPSNAVSREMRENADQNSAKFSKSELDQLVRSLKLSDGQCSILLRALKEKNRLEESIDVHIYDNLQKEFMQFFHVEGRTKRLKDVAGLFKRLNLDYRNPSEWVLYIMYHQAYKTLDCILTDQSGQESMIFLESQEVADPFQVLKQALEEADYKKYNWIIFGDFSAKLTKHFQNDKTGEQADACN